MNRPRGKIIVTAHFFGTLGTTRSLKNVISVQIQPYGRTVILVGAPELIGTRFRRSEMSHE